ncbi:galactose-proton symport [Ophiostoma piceae UAMH 11346]|uniref:Galactose-proton symport n=1 Tax=Ophiostoma piceae (strain UAMH 11346) TaxID=1262450 RepID=S3CSY0_OPHP1|nr:galactose-proton symport [Ophiostoma piceae UAMH 11346]
MSAPLKPHWKQPSHPAVQEVLFGSNGDSEFTTKSISRVELPPFALFAPLSSPPVTPASGATYATVQVGRNQHINLNSDLLYINHSCEPSLLFDMSSRNVWVGPKGLKPGDELTFFYPSTEWDMAQSFDCFCGHSTCRGLIGGARNMKPDQLAGLWLNGHIWELLKEQQESQAKTKAAKPVNGTPAADAAETALVEVLTKAEATLHKADEAAEAARRALAAHRTAVANKTTANGQHENGYTDGNGHINALSTNATNIDAAPNGAARHGTSSRELGGEMGGDTVQV